eukprot:GHVQ01039957.1.p1 GENE.GHVQ01039957.1~~GHVQ01039957.1.p1  ORF type:complete len:242 (+),score=40.21 GHVQ01039957.1:359-1084(+)
MSFHCVNSMNTRSSPLCPSSSQWKPNRIAQHGMHVPQSETPVVALKPGQTSGYKRSFYSQAAAASNTEASGIDLQTGKTSEETLPSLTCSSMYQTDFCPKTLQQEPSSNQQRQTQQRGLVDKTNTEAPKPETRFSEGAAGWISESHARFNANHGEKVIYHRHRVPLYQAASPPSCFGSSTCYNSIYKLDMGHHNLELLRTAEDLPQPPPDLRYLFLTGSQHPSGGCSCEEVHTRAVYIQPM